MKRNWLKILALLSASVTLVLLMVLGIHIYSVTRPKAPTTATRALARVDFKEDITASDADMITAWFYDQEGVDRVLCNAPGKTLVFSFSPLMVSADEVIDKFRHQFDYKAERYLPDNTAMAAGCPVGAGNGGGLASIFN